MPRQKVDINIGIRAFEEVKRLFPSIKTATIRTNCKKATIYNWSEGMAPDCLNLARLHYAGADVIYILTGKRTEG